MQVQAPPNRSIVGPSDARVVKNGTWPEPRGWLAGTALIMLGAIFMLQNVGALQLNNW